MQRSTQRECRVKTGVTLPYAVELPGAGRPAWTASSQEPPGAVWPCRHLGVRLPGSRTGRPNTLMAAQAVSTGAISEVAPWLSPTVPLKNGPQWPTVTCCTQQPFWGPSLPCLHPPQPPNASLDHLPNKQLAPKCFFRNRLLEGSKLERDNTHHLLFFEPSGQNSAPKGRGACAGGLVPASLSASLPTRGRRLPLTSSPPTTTRSFGAWHRPTGASQSSIISLVLICIQPPLRGRSWSLWAQRTSSSLFR